MKKSILIITGVLLACIFALAIIYSKVPKNVEAKFYTDEEINLIKSLVKPSVVIAKTNKTCSLYESEYENSEKKEDIEKNSELEIIKDKSMKWYKVKNETNEHIGWIKGEDIDIPADPPTNTTEMKDKYVEGFINIMDFESETDYFVWTDIDRQLTHILKGEKNDWKLMKTFKCSTGKNQSPTTRGRFIIGEKGKWFYSERLGSGAKYWVRFNETYLFHSVAMDKEQNIIDDVIGERRSSGCVRMEIDDIKWFYDKIPEGTSVFIN